MRKSTIQTGGAAAAYVPVDADFQWKNQSDELELDNNFAAQSFWKDVLLRYIKKVSAVIGLVLIIVITVLAIVGPNMNQYSYSEQNLSQKNFAPRVKALEGVDDGEAVAVVVESLPAREVEVLCIVGEIHATLQHILAALGRKAVEV